MSELKVEVVGLKDLSKKLRKIDSTAPKQLRLALNGTADLIISEARPLVPRRSGRAAGSMKAKSTRTESRISVGGNRAPHYPWLDFGGRTGIKKSVRRPFIKEGRYLYPTLRKNRSRVMEKLETSLAAAARDAGLDVS